ncbi:MAG: hypothetical protein SV186_06610 [Candidatus Nanohaloarchaea archaeon]|nr:hypothetical protein [Candidatus Nanohaloarchaea archaeon]
MYPRDHAILSAAVTAGSAAFLGLVPGQILLWTVMGTVAGVFIDVDHVFLSMLVTGEWDEGLAWLRAPHKAFMEPDRLLRDIEYPALVRHRILTHFLALAVLLAGTKLHVLFYPAAIGLAVHIAVDIVVDIWNGAYRA